MTERAIEKGTELQGLSTAILLPSVDLFGAPARQAVAPLTQIVGIPLFQRTVLTLQRAGIRQLIVLAGQEEEHLKHALGKGPRVTIPVRWMPIREFPLDDPRTWEALAAEVRGFCLLSSVSGVFSRTLIEQLRQDVEEGTALVVGEKAPARPGKARRGRSLVLPWEDGLGAIADLVVLPASVLSTATQVPGEAGTIPVRRWLERAAAEGRVRVRPVQQPTMWFQPVRHARDVGAAERRLLGSLKPEFEGVIDRYFNRALSRRFTRLFLALGLSPNTITLLATVVGLSATIAFGLGSYEAGLVGALLFQLSAVIDCCDGEVARLTFTESPFGAWLDIAMDNVVHMAIFGGIAVGAYARAAGEKDAWVPLVLGGAAILGNALSFWLVGRAQKLRQNGGWKTPVEAAWSDFMLKNIASRDFTVVVLLFALLGKLDLFLWIAAAGSLVFSGVMLWVVRPSAVGRPHS
ncbi:MAG TPA: CDP-alcohol phosphatidyltransferase family protein [Nitrospira sp.]|nr:CDP-alcohol phosphatidyltransferase family protein [Nitrospira sp.]